MTLNNMPNKNKGQLGLILLLRFLSCRRSLNLYDYVCLAIYSCHNKASTKKIVMNACLMPLCCKFCELFVKKREAVIYFYYPFTRQQMLRQSTFITYLSWQCCFRSPPNSNKILQHKYSEMTSVWVYKISLTRQVTLRKLNICWSLTFR